VPNYSTLEVMKSKFRTAILTCGEIDDDGDYYGSDSYGGGESSSDDGEDSSSGDNS
jgi:hypothetical protein